MPNETLIINKIEQFYNYYIFFGLFSFFSVDYFKDALPPGASYNPRDVGLDESVLAQIQLHDSGIGGYRFPTMIPTGTNIITPGAKHYRPNQSRPSGGPLSVFSKGAGKNSSPSVSPYSSASVPHAMNSISMPFVLAGPRRPFGRPSSHHRGHRVPYSATGKGFRSQYGYRAAASELKPQFVQLPNGSKGNTFKFLGQPVALGSSGGNGASATASAISPLLTSAALALEDGGNSSLGNIFGIRSIKGIKSLVSYLTGGVSG